MKRAAAKPALRDIRLTAGGARHIEIALSSAGYTPSQIESVKILWLRAHERAAGADLKLWSPVFGRRLRGLDGSPGLEVLFDANQRALCFLTAGARAPVRIPLRAGQALSSKQHADELHALDAHELVVTPEARFIGLIDRHPTLVLKALADDPHAQSRLGIARVSRPLFPAAFQEARATRDPSTGLLTREEIVELPPVGDLDVVGYFDQLRLERRLPLASTEAVRRFVMMIASPLLREVYSGALLGIYWITGPAGAGKEFCISIARAIWESVAVPGARAVVELRDASGAEDRKTIATAASAVYAQAREAGKHATSFLDHLIRMTGSSTLSVRGNYRDELELPNRLTFIADSAESVPDRREISRRTTVIEVDRIEEGFPSVAIRSEVAAMGPRIVASLKAMIESSGLDLAAIVSPEGRPHGQMFLSQLLGATPDKVEGEDLTPIFLAMVAYARRTPGHTYPATPNSPKIASTRPNYDGSHFVETMREEPGFQVLFKHLSTAKNLERRILREVPNYRKEVVLGQADYIEVLVDGRRYAFRFTSTRPLRFVFFPLDPNASEALLPRPRPIG